jgi:hypothetical protein
MATPTGLEALNVLMNRDTMRRKPGPQPAAPTQEELFREAYMTALGGLCSQFEVGLPCHKPQNATGTAELVRSRQLCLRAWNIAAYTVGLFSQEREIAEFNSHITTGGAEE